ncbi:MAG: redoxin domain-containing protein [Patescibacteria group bacterium]
MAKQEAPKLKDGDVAPYFSVVDINGGKVEINKDNGKKILLSFFRYSGCPWCNLAIYRLTEMAPELESQGVKVVCFVQSKQEDIVKNVINRHDVKPPFNLVPDPDKIIYGLYGVEESALKYFTSLRKLPEWIYSSYKLHYKQPEVDGSVTLVPAQFLIDSDGTIIKVHYGTDYADDMTYSEIKLAIASYIST